MKWFMGKLLSMSLTRNIGRSRRNLRWQILYCLQLCVCVSCVFFALLRVVIHANLIYCNIFGFSFRILSVRFFQSYVCRSISNNFGLALHTNDSLNHTDENIIWLLIEWRIYYWWMAQVYRSLVLTTLLTMMQQNKMHPENEIDSFFSFKWFSSHYD